MSKPKVKEKSRFENSQEWECSIAVIGKRHGSLVFLKSGRQPRNVSRSGRQPCLFERGLAVNRKKKTARLARFFEVWPSTLNCFQVWPSTSNCFQVWPSTMILELSEVWPSLARSFSPRWGDDTCQFSDAMTCLAPMWSLLLRHDVHGRCNGALVWHVLSAAALQSMLDWWSF
jgi:hypothetical protein